uniref:Uncharacterized protein n=1 Tax=Arundo donax TaxID=35708 RepID=A0A0A9GHQ7_ARUDO
MPHLSITRGDLAMGHAWMSSNPFHAIFPIGAVASGIPPPMIPVRQQSRQGTPPVRAEQGCQVGPGRELSGRTRWTPSWASWSRGGSAQGTSTKR